MSQPNKNPAAPRNEHVQPQHHVPGIDPLFLAEVNGNEIRAARGGVGSQTKADHKTVYQTAENADQKQVGRDGIAGDQIR